MRQGFSRFDSDYQLNKNQIMFWNDRYPLNLSILEYRDGSLIKKIDVLTPFEVIKANVWYDIETFKGHTEYFVLGAFQ